MFSEISKLSKISPEHLTILEWTFGKERRKLFPSRMFSTTFEEAKANIHFGYNGRPLCFIISLFIFSISCRIRVSDELLTPNPNSLKMDSEILWYLLYLSS